MPEIPFDPADRAVMEALKAPIPPDQIAWRKIEGGGEAPYIKDETVMEWLDSAVGPEGWETQILMADDHVLCRLMITLPSGRKLTRDGIGGYSEDRSDRPVKQSMKVKGGATDALKRAASLFGVGRQIKEDARACRDHQSSAPRRDSPPAPRRDSPPARQESRETRPAPSSSGGQAQGGYPPAQWPPKTGKQLWGWSSQNQRVDEVNEIGKEFGFPKRMVEWTDSQVAEVVQAMSDQGDQDRAPATTARSASPSSSGGTRRGSAPQPPPPEDEEDIPF
jgi:hypothetical protein